MSINDDCWHSGVTHPLHKLILTVWLDGKWAASQDKFPCGRVRVGEGEGEGAGGWPLVYRCSVYRTLRPMLATDPTSPQCTSYSRWYKPHGQNHAPIPHALLRLAQLCETAQPPQNYFIWGCNIRFIFLPNSIHHYEHNTVESCNNTDNFLQNTVDTP